MSKKNMVNTELHRAIVDMKCECKLTLSMISERMDDLLLFASDVCSASSSSLSGGRNRSLFLLSISDVVVGVIL